MNYIFTVKSYFIHLTTEKRAKKMEEIAAKRNAGEDDGTSVSGLSKLRRRRKKMTKNDEANAKSEAPAEVEEESSVAIKEETEDEKQRRLRAGKAFVVLVTNFCVSNSINSFPRQRNALRKWKR